MLAPLLLFQDRANRGNWDSLVFLLYPLINVTEAERPSPFLQRVDILKLNSVNLTLLATLFVQAFANNPGCGIHPRSRIPTFTASSEFRHNPLFCLTTPTPISAKPTTQTDAEYASHPGNYPLPNVAAFVKSHDLAKASLEAVK